MKRAIFLRAGVLVAALGVALAGVGCGRGTSGPARVVAQIEPAHPRRVEVDARDATRMIVVESTGMVSVWNIGRATKPERVLSLGAGAIDGHFYGKAGNIVTAGWDGIVCAWDVDGNLLWEAPGHDGAVRALAARPAADRIVSGGADGTVRVWDLDGKPVGTPIGGHEGMVVSVDLSPKGDAFASMDQMGTVRIFRQKSGTAEFEGAEVYRKPNALFDLYPQLTRDDVQWGWDHAVTFSPLGNLVAAAGFDGSLRFFRLDGSAYGAVVSSPDGNHVRSAVFSPDGNAVAVGTLGGNIQLVPISSTMPAPRHFWAHPNGATTSVGFSPLGDFLVSAGTDDRVVLWRPHGQQIGAISRGRVPKVTAVAVSSGDPAVAVGDWAGRIRIWGMDGTSRTAAVAAHESQVMALSFTARGDLLASSGGDKLEVWRWDLTPYTQPGGPYARALRVLEFSPAQPIMAGAARFDAIRFWPAFGFPRPEELHGLGAIHALTHSRDGKRIVAVDHKGQLRIWQTDGKPLSEVIQAHPGGYALSVAFSPDGGTVATGARDGKVAVFYADGTPAGAPFQAHSEAATALVFSPEGQLISGGGDGVVRYWDLATRKAVGAINLGIAVDRMGFVAGKLWVQAGTDYLYYFRPDRALAATMVIANDGMTAYTPDGSFAGESNGSNRPLLFARGGVRLSPEDAYARFSPARVARAILN